MTVIIAITYVDALYKVADLVGDRRMTVIIAITYVDALYKVVDLVGDSVDDSN